MENEITVIFVSFHSGHIIEKSIVTIDKNIKIIIVENSLNYKFKSEIERKYQNIKVIIPERNMGNGAGINIGLKNTKTKYAFYLDVDTELFPDTIKSLYNAAKELENCQQEFIKKDIDFKSQKQNITLLCQEKEDQIEGKLSETLLLLKTRENELLSLNMKNKILTTQVENLTQTSTNGPEETTLPFEDAKALFRSLAGLDKK